MLMQVRGASRIELLVLSVWIFVISFCASWGYDNYSWIGLIGGGIAGGVIPPILLHCLGFIEDFFWGGIPRVPVCRSGCCHKADYRFERLDSGEYASMCKCGIFYRKEGRRFLEVRKDGSSSHYLIWVPFKGWIQDKSE